MKEIKRMPLNVDDMRTEIDKSFAEDILLDVEDKSLNYGIHPLEYEYLTRAVCTMSDCNVKEYYTLVDEMRTYDAITWEHSLATAMHTSKMLFYADKKLLGITDRDCVDITGAAFFHDLGKLDINRDILNKPGKLTNEEFDEVKNHPLYGTCRLIAFDPFGAFTSRYTSIVVSMHHNKGGRGYSCLSEHLKRIQQHRADLSEKYAISHYLTMPFEDRHYLAADIVGICDSYSAQVELRPYTKPRLPQDAFDDIVKDLHRGGLLEYAKPLLGCFSTAYGLRIPEIKEIAECFVR